MSCSPQAWILTCSNVIAGILDVWEVVLVVILELLVRLVLLKEILDSGSLYQIGSLFDILH